MLTSISRPQTSLLKLNICVTNWCVIWVANQSTNGPVAHLPVSILYKSIASRYRSVRLADGPITARYRFIKNASWTETICSEQIYGDIFKDETYGYGSRYILENLWSLYPTVTWDSISFNYFGETETLHRIWL